MDGEQDLREGEYTFRSIMTNGYTSTNCEIVEFYNLRGGLSSDLVSGKDKSGDIGKSTLIVEET